MRCRFIFWTLWVPKSEIERLIEYFECHSITFAALCEDIKGTLLKLNLRLEDTVSQTYDGAANFSGHIKGCAKLFQATVEHAQYFHCSNHDLNLCSLPYLQWCSRNCEICLNSMTELGLFFKYSPKRTMLLESMIDEENIESNRKKKIPVQKVKVNFHEHQMDSETCGTRGSSASVSYQSLQTLDTITSEKGWDHKTVDLANGLL